MAEQVVHIALNAAIRFAIDAAAKAAIVRALVFCLVVVVSHLAQWLAISSIMNNQTKRFAIDLAL